MNLVTHTLQKPLSEYIESIFLYSAFMPDHEIERVVPTGHVFILFELDGMTRHTYDNQSLETKGTFRRVWISGMQRSYLSISAHQNSSMLVVQFKTHGAFPFLNQNLLQLNKKILPGEEIFGQEILMLQEQLLKETTSEEKFKLVEQWLNGIYQENNIPPDDLVEILEKLKVRPFAEHNSIIARYSKTQKHLISQFKKYFGLTPKVFHRIFRFNGILEKLYQNQKIVWTDIAYQFGYSDQSHFIKEFKEFSGFNPQEFIIAEHHDDHPNFFPVA